MSSRFHGISEAPPIPVFHLNEQCKKDSDPKKVNLTVGAYRTEEGEPWVLPVVEKVEKALLDDKSLTHEYLPVLGLPEFIEEATKLVLGKDSLAIMEEKVLGVQCLSGTGALRVGAETLAKLYGHRTVLVSKPTWGNHKMVFESAGFDTVLEYAYWDNNLNDIAFDQLIRDIENAPDGSVIVLHGCAHNPTGMDPMPTQWEQIATTCRRKLHLPFFDLAYQGFASGDPANDAAAIRYFVDEGFELVIAQSFAKNFGLYNERVGNLVFVTNDSKTIPPLRSQIQLIVRANYSNPPAHGARIVGKILKDDSLREEWIQSIQKMSSRIESMRSALVKELENLKTPGEWGHIMEQIGMFSFTGLNPSQCEHLIKKHKVYLMKDGRISLCGLTTKNVGYVARAIDESVRNVKSKNVHSDPATIYSTPYSFLFVASLFYHTVVIPLIGK